MSELPTSFISRELFVSTLEALQQQYVEDKKNSDVMGIMFGTEEIGKYDNSLLSNAILELLRMSFPKDEDGHCEIEQWAYVLEFGRYSENKEEAGQLYDRLCCERNEMSIKRYNDAYEGLMLSENFVHRVPNTHIRETGKP